MHDQKAPETPVDPILYKTEYKPRTLYSPQLIYASGALAALALGFGATSVALYASKEACSKYLTANIRIASGCAAVALALRLAARPVTALPGHAHEELPDCNKDEPVDYSIIIPVYNRPEHIRTLLATLASFYPRWASLGSGEIVIIDDGSRDDTADVARNVALSMPIPTRVLSKQNGGVSSARNTGFSNARGDICVVIDSDCLPEVSWLPSMLASIRNDSQLLVFSRIRNRERIAYPLENMPDCKGFAGASYGMQRFEYLRLGGCYEGFGASHDDRDLVLKALANGYRVGYASEAWIEHPLRRESMRSIWKVGLNSRYGNLLAARHGINAASATRPTAYYLFGIGSNYGTSIAIIVGIGNLALSLYFVARQPKTYKRIVQGLTRKYGLILAVYAGALISLGLYVGAPIGDLPEYVVVLALFHTSTFVGRLRGTFEYGVALL